MSYLMESEGAGQRRSRWWLVALAAVLVVAAAVAAFSLGRASDPDPDPASPGGGAALSWTRVGPWVAPVSATHGPFRSASGLASGFSHDTLGAAIAGMNIAVRLSSDVAPMVSSTTARTQTYGDVTALLAQIRAQPTGGSSTPTEVYYRVVSGDPADDLVLISIAQRTAESTVAGGYFAASLTLHWQDGDWRLQVPLAPAQLMRSVEGYTPLGAPDV